MELREKFILVANGLKSNLVERDDEIDVLIWAILARLNILFLGMPGIAKTLMTTLFAGSIEEAEIFSRLMTKTTVPEELFGMYKLSKLELDVYERNIKDTILTAHFAILDEIFKANTSILNSLLEVILEKRYKNGDTTISIPLLSLIGASNEIPSEEDGLNAFYDRFVVKLKINSIIEESNFIKMLETDIKPLNKILTLDDIKNAQKEVDAVIITSEVKSIIAQIRGKLMQEGLEPSDRTFKLSLALIKARAWMSGRTQTDEEDVEALRHTLWSDPEKIKKITAIILELCNPAMSKIYELLDEATSLHTEMVASNLKDTKDRKNNYQNALDISGKLKNIREELLKFTLIVKASKDNAKKLIKVQQQVDKFLQNVYSLAIQSEGVNLNETIK